MADPVRIGNLVEYQAGDDDGSTTISVPADAEIIVIGVHGYASYAYTFTLDDPWAGMSVGGDVCAIEVNQGNASTSYFQGALFVGDVRTKTGTQTLAWAFDSTLVNPARIVYGFYKGVDLSAFPSSVYRDKDGAQANPDPYTTPTLTAASGDLIVAWAWAYSGGQSDAPTWSNAASVADYLSLHGHAVGSWAEGSPSGNTTVGVSAWTDAEDGGVCAIVLKPAAEGGTIEEAEGAAAGTSTATAIGTGILPSAGSAAGLGAASAVSRNIPLTATPGSSLIHLAWTALPDATGHKVERREAP